MGIADDQALQSGRNDLTKGQNTFNELTLVTHNNR